MKQFLLLSFPLFYASFIFAQEKKHRFENDTLYTSSGFKIYKGQTLQIANKANDFIGFKYISKLSTLVTSLENNSVVVKELSGYGFSPTGSAIINVRGSIIYRDGSKGMVSFTLAFDLAIGTRLPGSKSELIIPEEYRISKEEAMTINRPALIDDTLYTSSGFKIYKGQLLQFGKPTGKRGNFRYVNIRTGITHNSVANRQVRVKELKEFGISALGNAYITIIGTLIVKNTDRMEVEIHMAFDHAIENVKGIPGELVVPDEYKGVVKTDKQAELKRIENLYLDEIISKEEFEAGKKNLLQQ